MKAAAVGSYHVPDMVRLRICLGPVGSAKNRRFREELKQRLRQDRADSLLYLVPSRSFARQIEKAMLDELPGFFSLPLITFGPLFKDLFSALQDKRKLISDAARDALMIGLVENARKDGSLSVIGASAAGRGMSRTLKRLFATFGRHSLTSPGHIRRITGRQSAQSISKLNDALIVYGRYRAALERNGLIDAEHAGVLVCEALSQGHEGLAKRLQGVELMIVEGFFSFSPLEERFVLSLIKALPETWVSLDLVPQGSDEVFELPRRTLAALETLSGSADIKIERFSAADDSRAARRRIGNRIYSDYPPQVLSQSTNEPSPHGEPPTDIHVVEAADPRRELSGMAKAIKMLIVDGRCKPGRIVVSFPQLGERERDVRKMLSEYGIPVAGPETLLVLHSAAVRAFLSVLDMVQEGFRRDDVLEFLRCPFLRPEALIKQTGDGHPKPIDPEYIDAQTRKARIQGGGAGGIESFRVGFAALRGRMAESRASGDDADTKSKKLAIYDERTGALFQVLEALRARLGGPFALCSFCDACLKLISELETAQRLAVAFHKSEKPSMVRAELKALSRFIETVEEVSKGLAAGGISEAPLTLLRSAVLSGLKNERVKTPAASEGVRLLPMKEAWLSPCDYLFCGGLTEAAFPGPVRGDVLLPMDARTRLGLRPLDEKVRESKFLSHSLLLRPQKGVCLSYPTSVDEKPTLRATCLHEIETAGSIAPVRWEELGAGPDAPCAADELQSVLGSWARSRQTAVSDELLWQSLALVIQSSQDTRGGCVTPRGLVRRLESSMDRATDGSRFDGMLSESLAAHIRNLMTDEELSKSHGQPVLYLSRSALEEYINCPFKFFARRVLGLGPEEEFDPDVPPKDIGTLIHQILYSFYDGRRQQDGSISPVTPSNLDEARTHLLETATKHVRMRVTPGFPRGRISSLLLAPGGLLDAFLENEAAEQQGWRPVALECSFGGSKHAKRDSERLSQDPLLLGCEVDGREEIVAINGIIDRLDVRIEGERTAYRVLDYKTGAIPQPKDIREGTSLQLPIYVAAIRQILGSDAAAGYYILSETRKIGIKDYVKQQTLDTAVENLGRVVSDILRGVLAGDFAPRPLNDNVRLCSYCDFRAACRMTRVGSGGV